VLGLAVAIPIAALLRRTVLRGEGSPFVMELPRYQRPSLRNVGLRVVDRSRAFLSQAGTIILAMSIVVWALGYFPRPREITGEFDIQRSHARAALGGSELSERLDEIDGVEAGTLLRQSVLGRMGAIIEPALAPLGWDWRMGVAVLAAFPAREIAVSTLAVLFDLGEAESAEEGGRSQLAERLYDARTPSGEKVFTLPIALSVLVFFALCCQCGATLATVRRETRSWTWPSFVFLYMTLLAYVGAWITTRLASTWL
jgi:ferrous iron transport protein B